jgi:hypothetical protein
LNAKKLAAIIFLTSLVVSVAYANQIDSRFDGQWVGVETFPGHGGFGDWAGQVPQYRTVISISNSGQNVRVLSGFVTGRYWVSPKSNGSTLIFYGSNGRAGRKNAGYNYRPMEILSKKAG